MALVLTSLFFFFSWSFFSFGFFPFEKQKIAHEPCA